MKVTMYCPDIECGSCVKVIDKELKKLSGINSYSITNSKIDIDYDDSLCKPSMIKQVIMQKGYRISDTYQPKSKIKERVKEFIKDKTKYQFEYKFLKYVIATFLILVIAEGIYAYIRSSSIPGYFNNTFMWLFYLTLIIVSIGGALWHFKSHKTKVTCMVGMMIGMTLGMQSGMMLAPILAKTVGFSPSAAISMVLASIVGYNAGKCCGIMGAMEGIMAGIMGGLMGAMVGAMMMNNLVWFMPIYMVLNLIVLGGFVYMVFEEVVEGKETVTKQPISYWKFLLYNAIILIILTIVIDQTAVMMMNMPDMIGMDMGM